MNLGHFLNAREVQCTAAYLRNLRPPPAPLISGHLPRWFNVLSYVFVFGILLFSIFIPSNSIVNINCGWRGGGPAITIDLHVGQMTHANCQEETGTQTNTFKTGNSKVQQNATLLAQIMRGISIYFGKVKLLLIKWENLSNRGEEFYKSKWSFYKYQVWQEFYKSKVVTFTSEGAFGLKYG